MSEKYEPAIDDEIEARSNMDDVQKEMSAIREMYVERNPEFENLPLDLKYSLEYNVWATGRLAGGISGTFEGRKIDVEKSAWSLDKINYFGTSDGNDMPPEDAEDFYKKYYPVIQKFDEMKQREGKAELQVKKEESEQQSAHKSNLESERRIGYESGYKEGEIAGVLKERATEILSGGGDSEFIENIYRIVSGFSGKVDGSVVIMKAFQDEGIRGGVSWDEYSRNKESLFNLLGVNKDEPQVWESGFSFTYVHSRIYDTIFPGITIRETYDRVELGGRDGAMLYVEKNSRFQ